MTSEIQKKKKQTFRQASLLKKKTFWPEDHRSGNGKFIKEEEEEGQECEDRVHPLD